jgi:hypothetical protein
MKRTIWLACGLTALMALGLVAGCGEKITIPEAVGEFGLIDYDDDAGLTPAFDVREIKFSAAGLYVLGADRLERRNINFVLADSLHGLNDAGSLCVDLRLFLVFVWEASAQRISWYDAVSLEWVGESILPSVASVVAMATNNSGTDPAFSGSRTFLYLSDPAAAVVHRYRFDPVNGLESHGILTRADGDAARFTHIPAGLTTDLENKLLVCDKDSLRNWVIRFDSTPDPTDVTPSTTDEDPRRGLAYPFRDSGCNPPPAGDFVLGFARECNGPADWQGRIGSAPGEFHAPSAAAVDGSGRIFVTDTGNDRIQVFTAEGDHVLEFGSAEKTPAPRSIGVIDQVTPRGVHFGAFVFVHLPAENLVVRFISSEHKDYLAEEKPIELP